MTSKEKKKTLKLAQMLREIPEDQYDQSVMGLNWKSPGDIFFHAVRIFGDHRRIQDMDQDDIVREALRVMGWDRYFSLELLYHPFPFGDRKPTREEAARMLELMVAGGGCHWIRAEDFPTEEELKDPKKLSRELSLRRARQLHEIGQELLRGPGEGDAIH